MTKEQATIQELRKQKEALEKKLAEKEGLPGLDQLNALMDGFAKTTTPGIEGINKVVKDLERTAKSFEGMQTLLSKMTKGDIEKIMKRKK